MDLVNVLVPEDRVLEVYALLGQSPGNGVATPQSEVWSREELIRFYRESPEAMKAFLEHLAANTDRWVTIDEMAKTLRLTREQIAGVMGAGGRRLHNRHGKPRGWQGWFLRFERNRELRMIQYRMPEDVAAAIREARG